MATHKCTVSRPDRDRGFIKVPTVMERIDRTVYLTTEEGVKYIYRGTVSEAIGTVMAFRNRNICPHADGFSLVPEGTFAERVARTRRAGQ